MKKIFVILLTVSMLFGLVSCFKPGNNNEHTVHTDANKDGLCDGCQGIFVDYSEPTLVGKALKHSVKKQFSEAKSLKIDFQLRFVHDEESWSYKEAYDSEQGIYVETEEVDHQASYTEGIANIEILLSIGDDGVDAKMTATTKIRSSADDEFTVDESETVYIIDGYAYSPLNDGYYEKGEVVPEELSNILEQFGDVSIDDEKKNELIEALSIEVATVFNIQDNKGSFSFDAKPGLDKVLDYLNNIDMENDTVEKILDDILKEISPDLTSAKIVDELERIAGLTVTQALDELDAWLTENYDTTLQGIYNSVLADEDAYAAIEQIVAMVNELDPAFADDKEALDAIMAEIKAFDIRATVEEMEIKDVVLFDIIASILPPVSTDPETNEPVYITKDEAFEAIRSFLDITLKEFEETADMTLFSTLKELASAVTLNKLNGKLDLNFVGALELSTVVAELNFDIDIDVASEVEGKNNHTGFILEADLTLSDISKEVVQITLPEGSKSLHDDFTSDNVDLKTYYHDGGEKLFVDLDFTITDETGRPIEIYANSIAVDELEKGNVTVKVGYLYYCSAYYYFNEGQDFTFKVDLEAGTVTIVTLPDMTKAENY